MTHGTYRMVHGDIGGLELEMDCQRDEYLSLILCLSLKRLKTDFFFPITSSVPQWVGELGQEEITVREKTTFILREASKRKYFILSSFFSPFRMKNSGFHLVDPYIMLTN